MWLRSSLASAFSSSSMPAASGYGQIRAVVRKHFHARHSLLIPPLSPACTSVPSTSSQVPLDALSAPTDSFQGSLIHDPPQLPPPPVADTEPPQPLPKPPRNAVPCQCLGQGTQTPAFPLGPHQPLLIVTPKDHQPPTAYPDFMRNLPNPAHGGLGFCISC